MLTVAFQLTPEDLEEARNRSIGVRIVRVTCAAFSGLFGLALIYGNVLLVGGWGRVGKNLPVALIPFSLAFPFLWAATDFAGLHWFLSRYDGTFASREVRFRGDTITISSRGKSGTWVWLRERGWIETTNLFVLFVRGSGSGLIVPKRAFTSEQEHEFRALRDRPSQGPSFVLDFFLTEADVRKAGNTTTTWLSSAPGRTIGRVICAAGAVFFLVAPGLNLFRDIQGGWPGMWRTSPLGSVLLIALCTVGLWVATGSIGLEGFVRRLNHYDERRVYTLSELDIVVRRGDRTQRYVWKRFLSFRETAHAFILQMPLLTCYIIPKPALGSYTEDQFRDFLLSKLPQACDLTFSFRATNC